MEENTPMTDMAVNDVSSQPAGSSEPQGSTVQRGDPDITEARRKLVKSMQAEVTEDKSHWKSTFKKMREDQDFCRGAQWKAGDFDTDMYTVNITLRHVQQRVASLYARNPKVVARRKERLLNTVWDGTMSGVIQAMTQMQQFQMGGDPMAMQQPMSVLSEVQQSVAYKQQMDRFAKTFELLYDYNVSEQAFDFKSMLKMTIRRAVTTGVGYVKLGFQRAMELSPAQERALADVTEKMANVEYLANQIADGKVDAETSAEVEALRLQMEDLQANPEQVVREGLIFDYPESTAIIPDRHVRQLKNFLGADRVTQEYQLTPKDIEKIYGIDVGTSFRAYRPGTTNDPMVSPVNESRLDSDIWGRENPDNLSHRDKCLCMVWETYDRTTGLVYVMCEGYPDFLAEPAQPDVYTEHFYPWYPIVLNECDHPAKVFPPSDVTLIKHQAKEYNRLRQGLREHRMSNRPATIAASGTLSEDDYDKMVERPANALIELQGLQPGQSVDQLVQPLRLPGIDPNLYESASVFDDVLRAVGVQEANMGAMSGGTATESSIAESARQSSLSSNVDDLDDTLTAIARASGQILLAEVSPETVKEVVGPGAVWPQMDRDQLAKEFFLEVEAGSTGRPNQAQEIQNYERLAPLLMQIPGISPELLAKEGIRRLDDRLELSDLFDANQLSIQAMNQQAGAGVPPEQAGAEDPAAQGAEGAQNAPTPDAPAGASSAGTQPPPPMV